MHRISRPEAHGAMRELRPQSCIIRVVTAAGTVAVARTALKCSAACIFLVEKIFQLTMKGSMLVAVHA